MCINRFGLRAQLLGRDTRCTALGSVIADIFSQLRQCCGFGQVLRQGWELTPADCLTRAQATGTISAMEMHPHRATLAQAPSAAANPRISPGVYHLGPTRSLGGCLTALSHAHSALLFWTHAVKYLIYSATQVWQTHVLLAWPVCEGNDDFLSSVLFCMLPWRVVEEFAIACFSLVLLQCVLDRKP